MSGVAFSQNLEHWQSLGLRCFLASFFVMIATWLVYLSLRKHSAALRHRVLYLGLVGMLMLPILVLASRGICPELRLANQNKIAKLEHPAKPLQYDTAPSPSIPPEYSSLQIDEMDKEIVELEEGKLTTVTSMSPPESKLLGQTSPTPSAASDVARSDSNRLAFKLPAVSLWSLPLLAWAVVAGVLCIRALLNRIFLKRVLRSSIIVTEERTLQILRSVARRHQMREVPLLCSDTLRVPMAIGMMRPSIVLPSGYGKWSDERLRVVLLHEMMHICRADVLAQSVAGLACTLFWFNPLAWKAASRMRLERELASDDSVLLAGEDAIDYAGHLVEIAAAIGRQFRVPEGASAMATHTNLGSRVARLMQQDIDRSPLTRRASNVLWLIAAVIVTCLTTATPMLAKAQNEPNSTKGEQDLRTEVTISGDLSSDWLEKLKAMPNLEKLIIRRPSKNFRAGGIVQLTTVKRLQVEDFPLRTSMADVVMQNATKMPSLRNATFKGTGLTSKGLNALSDSSMVALSLIDEELLTDDAFHAIGKMKSLESLELNGTPIEAPGLIHLQECPKLRRFVMVRDPGATKRLPEIAKFKMLEQLELSDTGSNELVDLKDAKSLRELTLRRCGISNSLNTLELLTQLKRVSLDNTDITDESFADVRRRFEGRGTNLVDITQMVAVENGSQADQAENRATELARRVHRELDFAKRHSSFWMKWKTDGGNIPSMKGERIRTVHLLKEALGRDYVKRPSSYSDSEYVIAWTPSELFNSSRYFKNGEVDNEQYKYGDANLAWARESRSGDRSPRHFPRNGVKAFEDGLFPMSPQLQISHQSFWWGTALHHNLTTSSISPETATYRELPSETFGGEECRVLESPGRSERMWISISTGRLLGLLKFAHQGYFTPFYRQPIVTAVVGHEVQSNNEYREVQKKLTDEQKSKLNQAWSEYMFDSGIPWSLYSFSDYREVLPQTWFPFEVRSSGWLHNKENEQYYDFYVSTASVSELATDRSDLKSMWQELLPKEGEDVQDQRFAVAVDYKYKQDRTTAEIEALVSQQLFKFAESQLLIDERRNPLNELINKPAMDVPDVGWLGERPDLKGNPYILHFWATWCGPCKNDVPVLNAIAKNSIVIGVHPSGTPEDEIRQSMRDAKMTYPTIMATSDNPLGYRVSMFPYCVKVDAHGNVIAHGFLDDVLGTTPPISTNKVFAGDSNTLGRVIATKPESRLIHFSLGTKDGIEPQQMLDIIRDGKRISQIRVVLIKENQSVGLASKNEEFSTILVNDTVQP